MKKLTLCLLCATICLRLSSPAQTPARQAPALAASTPDSPDDIAGTWQGTLELAANGKDPGGKLRIVVKITKKDGGGWNAVDYSIDQNPTGMICSDVTLRGGTFKYTIPAINGSYEGKLSADGNYIVGKWTQGQPLPLTYVRATKETAWDIPEPPKPPKPMPPDADPSFEVATIKPNDSGGASMQQLTINGRNFTIRNGSLGDMIAFAYNLQMKQIANGPDWMDKDRYDVAAVTEPEGMPNPEQLKTMIRKLLADRFQLKFHQEKRELAAFVLTVDKGGNKLTPSQAKISLPGFFFHPAKGGMGLGVRNATLGEFSEFLQSAILDRPMVNNTGIEGRYDFDVAFTPDDSQFNGRPPKMPVADGADPAPDLFSAMQLQIGLKIGAEKTQVDVVAIDHVEKPSEN